MFKWKTKKKAKPKRKKQPHCVGFFNSQVPHKKLFFQSQGTKVTFPLSTGKTIEFEVC